jgi:uncharacterized membrane protein SpoIIM required for sporulation
MRFLDRAFAVATGFFILGSFTGVLVVLLAPSARSLMISIFQVRMLTPLRTVSSFGNAATLGLIFANNSIPALLSFLYPVVIMKVEWTPPLTKERRNMFMCSFTTLCAFLIGMFDLGGVLAIEWELGGISLLVHLLSTSTVHGSLEFFLVLLCVSEPLRIIWTSRGDTIEATMEKLRDDVGLLLICLIGLFVSAVVEVYLLL